MATNWFVRREDEEFGPFTPDEIRQRAAVGWLREIDFIRPNKETAWIPATRIKDLRFGTPNATNPANKPPLKNDQSQTVSGKSVFADEQLRGVINNNADARSFKILAPLLEDEEIQFLILMFVADIALESETDLSFEYSLGDANQTCGKGPSFLISELHDKLFDADILVFERRRHIRLTSLGKEFAEWLIENGYRAEYFASPLGFWGKKPTKDFFNS